MNVCIVGDGLPIMDVDLRLGREPERKTQSRWEYRITDQGKVWLKQQQDMASIMEII